MIGIDNRDHSGSEYVGSDSDAKSNSPTRVYSFTFCKQGLWVAVNCDTSFYVGQVVGRPV